MNPCEHGNIGLVCPDCGSGPSVMPEEVFAIVLARYLHDGMAADLDALTRHDARLRHRIEHLTEARAALIHYGRRWERLATASLALAEWGRIGTGSVPIHKEHQDAIQAWHDAVADLPALKGDET